MPVSAPSFGLALCQNRGSFRGSPPGQFMGQIIGGGQLIEAIKRLAEITGIETLLDGLRGNGFNFSRGTAQGFSISREKSTEGAECVRAPEEKLSTARP